MKISEIFANDINLNKTIQFLRFILVGGSTAFIDFLLLFILTYFFNVNYLVSAAIGFLIGSTLNYLLSIKWVFINGKFSKLYTEFIVFLIFTTLGLVLNHFVMFIFSEILLYNYMISKMISLIIVTLFNFLTKKYLIFIT